MPLSLEKAAYQNIEQWNEKEVNEGAGHHSADDGCSNGILGAGAGAGGQCEWQDAKKKASDVMITGRSRVFIAPSRLDQSGPLR